MYTFKAKYTNMLSCDVKEVLIEIEEPQVDNEYINEMGYKNMTHFMWVRALAKALESYPSRDYTFDGIELISC